MTAGLKNKSMRWKTTWVRDGTNIDMDDDFCRQYMSKRMNEIKELARKSKYGSVIEINKQDYVEKVTNADPESFVVISMYQDYN